GVSAGVVAAVRPASPQWRPRVGRAHAWDHPSLSILQRTGVVARHRLAAWRRAGARRPRAHRAHRAVPSLRLAGLTGSQPVCVRRSAVALACLINRRAALTPFVAANATTPALQG